MHISPTELLSSLTLVYRLGALLMLPNVCVSTKELVHWVQRIVAACSVSAYIRGHQACTSVKIVAWLFASTWLRILSILSFDKIYWMLPSVEVVSFCFHFLGFFVQQTCFYFVAITHCISSDFVYQRSFSALPKEWLTPHGTHFYIALTSGSALSFLSFYFVFF